jgi:hypothetical protein
VGRVHAHELVPDLDVGAERQPSADAVVGTPVITRGRVADDRRVADREAREDGVAVLALAVVVQPPVPHGRERVVHAEQRGQVSRLMNQLRVRREVVARDFAEQQHVDGDELGVREQRALERGLVGAVAHVPRDDAQARGRNVRGRPRREALGLDHAVGRRGVVALLDPGLNVVGDVAQVAVG